MQYAPIYSLKDYEVLNIKGKAINGSNIFAVRMAYKNR